MERTVSLFLFMRSNGKDSQSIPIHERLLERADSDFMFMRDNGKCRQSLLVHEN